MGDEHVIEMLPRARERWRSLSEDDRYVLAYALRDAIKRPDRVGTYALEFFELTTTEIVQFHTFRFGYANFVIATTEGGHVFICDIWLDGDMVLAAE